MIFSDDRCLLNNVGFSKHRSNGAKSSIAFIRLLESRSKVYRLPEVAKQEES